MPRSRDGIVVVGGDLGSTPDLLREGVTGFLFEPGDPLSLAVAVQRAWEKPDLLRRMRRDVRQRFDDAYTASANYDRLVEIYKRAMLANKLDRSARGAG